MSVLIDNVIVLMTTGRIDVQVTGCNNVPSTN